jgi:hypothetical protein
MLGSKNPQPKRKIFINYRRMDNPDFVERIRDWFLMRYGRDSVFMDFDTIPPFTRFADFIRSKVKECDVLVAVIGPRWLELMRERGGQQDEEDYVQTEIKLALEEGKLIAPICIKGVSVPRAQDLPPELRPMLAYNVAHLNSGRSFLDNIELIMDAVERELAGLEGLTLISHDMRSTEFATPSGFNIRLAIASFEEASEKHDWQTALDWLSRIRASGFMPRFYPIDDYEREIRDAMRLEAIERDYDVIRLMAQRTLKRREDPSRIWTALLDFWQANPGYDPDAFAAQFGPQVMAGDEFEPEMGETASPALIESAIEHFDDNILDGLDTINPADADGIFDLDVLASLPVPPGKTLSFDEARQRGIVSNTLGEAE